MRLIGMLSDEKVSQRFSDYLYSQGIETQIDPKADGDWEIWVLDDDDLAEAESLLADFQNHPEDSVFIKGARIGVGKKQQDKKAQAAKRYRTIDSSRAFYRGPATMGVVTLTLMALSIGITVITRLGKVEPIVLKLTITEYEVQGNRIRWDGSLPEIRRGQVWRLITPIFLHFHILHILFNMLWLRDLGSTLEARGGSRWFLFLVLILAVSSNMGEFIWRAPNFGGMSGVVYGLLGYMWIQGRLNPSSGLALRPQIVVMMLIWLALGLTGQMGMANGAHVVGLLTGMACGAITATWTRRRR